MNMWNALATPPAHRPGDANPTPPKARKRRLSPLRSTVPPVEPNPWRLTAHECAVIKGFVEALTAKEIGLQLCLSHKTIEAHSANLKAKMGAKSLLQAALYWDRFKRRAADKL